MEFGGASGVTGVCAEWKNESNVVCVSLCCAFTPPFWVGSAFLGIFVKEGQNIAKSPAKEGLIRADLLVKCCNDKCLMRVSEFDASEHERMNYEGLSFIHPHHHASLRKRQYEHLLLWYYVAFTRRRGGIARITYHKPKQHGHCSEPYRGGTLDVKEIVT